MNKVTSRLNLTRDALATLLGEPDDMSYTTKRNKWPRVYKYGRDEYVFTDEGRVCLIYTYNGEGADREYVELAKL